MNKLLTGTGLAIAIAGVVSVFSATPGYAQTIRPSDDLPSTYGLVGNDFSGGTTLRVRTMDGVAQTYSVSPEVARTLNLRRGELVGFDTDEAGMITSLRPPSVARQYQGTIQNIAYSDIDGADVGTITLALPDGSVETTQASAATIANSGLGQGDDLVVTEFQGTFATKLCRPLAAAPDPIIEPEPVILPPSDPLPVPALW